MNLSSDLVRKFAKVKAEVEEGFPLIIARVKKNWALLSKFYSLSSNKDEAALPPQQVMLN